MILSIITCTFKPRNLSVLFDSLSTAAYINQFEIIIVNQSGSDIHFITKNYPYTFKTVVPVERLSAANARNFGATHSKAQFLHFIDDDAFYADLDNNSFSKLIGVLTDEGHEMYVAQRGEIEPFGAYVSQWPSAGLINIQNFPRFIIEWNFFIKRTLFNSLGCFPDIGTGSNHMAQSGEVFVIAAKAIVKGVLIKKLYFLKIAHPSLTGIAKEKKIKYLYGAGYAVGLIVKLMKFNHKLYWVARTAASTLKPAEFSKYKIMGLIDGLRNKLPRKTFN